MNFYQHVSISPPRISPQGSRFSHCHTVTPTSKVWGRREANIFLPDKCIIKILIHGFVNWTSCCGHRTFLAGRIRNCSRRLKLLYFFPHYFNILFFEQWLETKAVWIASVVSTLCDPVNCSSVCVCVCVCVCVHTCTHIHSCLTLPNPMDCSPLGSSTHGIFHAQILESVAISSSRGSSQPRDWIHISWVSCIGKQIL